MKYKNTVNGNVIDVNSKISGTNWEKVEEIAGEVIKTSSAGAKGKKKSKVNTDEQ